MTEPLSTDQRELEECKKVRDEWCAEYVKARDRLAVLNGAVAELLVCEENGCNTPESCKELGCWALNELTNKFRSGGSSGEPVIFGKDEAGSCPKCGHRSI